MANGKTENVRVTMNISGFGIFYYANGTRFEGYWKDNKK
jgi:hypothetical protein